MHHFKLIFEVIRCTLHEILPCDEMFKYMFQSFSVQHFELLAASAINGALIRSRQILARGFDK